jgi:hypothetical protein
MSSLVNADVVPEGDSEPVDPKYLRLFPSLNAKTGDLGPLPRGPKQSSAGYVHPDAAREHEAQMAIVRRDEARLRAMYPSMYEPPRTRPMAPAEPDPRLKAMFPSMPNGYVPGDGPKPEPPAATRPAATPPTQPATVPVTKPVASSETAAAEPASPPAELPPQYAGLAVPEGFEPGEGFATAAAVMAEAGLDRRQAEAMVATYADLQQREMAALNAQQAQWRATAERSLTAEDRAGIQAAMADAPEAVRDLLNRTGIGDHPVLVKFIASLGRKLAATRTPVERLAANYSSMQRRHG